MQAATVAHHQATGRVRDDLASRQHPVLQGHGPILHRDYGAATTHKGGGFADLEFALATAAGLIGPHTISVTVHELQLRPAGTIPLTGHDVRVDFIVTPDRIIDCRPGHGPRPTAGICWDDLTEEKIVAIPLLAAQRAGRGKPTGG